MDVYSTEEEQIEQLKKWWKENWMSLVGGVFIGLAILGGGKYWIDSRNHQMEMASFEYENMIQALNSDNKELATSKGELLLGQYVDTPYASLASLAMAKLKVESGDLTTAKTHLRWAMDKAEQEPVKLVARLRLATVLLAESNYDEAVSLLNAVDPGTYRAAYEELKGDIYAAKGETDNARNAYSIALAAMEPNARTRNYLQMKIDDLGTPANPIGES